MTRVYWQAARRGQSIGGFRETSQRFDAYLTTSEYYPRNSKNGFTDVEDAKAFVESFRSWELYSAEGTEVEPEVRPAYTRSGSLEEPHDADPLPPPVAAILEPAPQVAPPSSNKRWWEFWK